MQARAQKTLFKVGDKAVYPAQGVAEVISIEEKDIAGQRQQVLRAAHPRHQPQDHGAGRQRAERRSAAADQREGDPRDLRDPARAHDRFRQPDLEPPLPRLHGQDQDRIGLRRRRGHARPVPPQGREVAVLRRAPHARDRARADRQRDRRRRARRAKKKFRRRSSRSSRPTDRSRSMDRHASVRAQRR